MLLLHDGGWDPPFDEEPERTPRHWHLPWRTLAWFAVWCWLMALVPIVGRLVSNVAAYGVVLLSLLLVFWRIERLCQRFSWTGMRDYKS